MSNKCVYVYNLTNNVSEEHLKEIFGVFGTLRDVLFLSDNDKPYFNYSVVCAKVRFDKEEDAKSAKEYMDGGQIDGKIITVKLENGLNQNKKSKDDRNGRVSARVSRSDSVSVSGSISNSNSNSNSGIEKESVTESENEADTEAETVNETASDTENETEYGHNDEEDANTVNEIDQKKQRREHIGKKEKRERSGKKDKRNKTERKGKRKNSEMSSSRSTFYRNFHNESQSNSEKIRKRHRRK